MALEVNMKATVRYYPHSYQSAGFSPEAKVTHSCLREGDWCWKNAFENPIEAIKFILGKI